MTVHEVRRGVARHGTTATWISSLLTLIGLVWSTHVDVTGIRRDVTELKANVSSLANAVSAHTGVPVQLAPAGVRMLSIPQGGTGCAPNTYVSGSPRVGWVVFDAILNPVASGSTSYTDPFTGSSNGWTVKLSSYTGATRTNTICVSPPATATIGNYTVELGFYPIVPSGKWILQFAVIKGATKGIKGSVLQPGAPYGHVVNKGAGMPINCQCVQYRSYGVADVPGGAFGALGGYQIANGINTDWYLFTPGRCYDDLVPINDKLGFRLYAGVFQPDRDKWVYGAAYKSPGVAPIWTVCGDQQCFIPWAAAQDVLVEVYAASPVAGNTHIEFTLLPFGGVYNG